MYGALDKFNVLTIQQDVSIRHFDNATSYFLLPYCRLFRNEDTEPLQSFSNLDKSTKLIRGRSQNSNLGRQPSDPTLIQPSLAVLLGDPSFGYRHTASSCEKC